MSEIWRARLMDAQEKRRRKHQNRQRHVHWDVTLDFAGNDYLGLASDVRVAKAAAAAARRFGSGARASHLVSGHLAIHQELEEALARFTGRQKALLFSTGYMANLGVLQALADAHTAIFQDRLNHASLLDGGQLSGARTRRFHHGSMSDLTRLLERSSATHKLIVSDGVFSMDGDIADIAALAEISRQHAAWLMIDDAHGLGVLGNDGSGSVGTRFDSDAVPILVGTLGKALGSGGAFVAGDALLIEHLMQFARSYVYTTAQPPAVAAASLAALRIVESEPERRERLRQNVYWFRREAQTIGLPLADATTPIQPLLLGDEQRTLAWAAALKEEGLKVGAIRPPTVAPGQARLRITLSARHSRRDIERLLAALTRCWQQEAA